MQYANQDNLIFPGASPWVASNIVISRINSSYAYQNGIVSITNSSVSGATISNSSFSYNGLFGIDIGKSSHDWTISNNNIYSNLTGGIQSWCDDSSILRISILNNNIYSNTGDAIHMDTITAPDYADGSFIAYNTVYNNSSTGIYIEHGTYNTVAYNLVYGNSGYGIWVGDYTHISQASYNKIYNNTVADGNTWGIVIQGSSTGEANMSVGNLIENNISYGNNGYQLLAQYGGENDGTMGHGNVYMYNSFGPQATNFINFGGNKSTYSSWETTTGMCGSIGCSHSVQSDPQFVNAAGNDFHLQLSSSAINAGTPVGLTSDYTGTSVPQGSAPDIGAYEFLTPSSPSSLAQYK